MRLAGFYEIRTHLGISASNELLHDCRAIFRVNDIWETLSCATRPERLQRPIILRAKRGRRPKDSRSQELAHLLIRLIQRQKSVYACEVFPHEVVKDALRQSSLLRGVEAGLTVSYS